MAYRDDILSLSPDNYWIFDAGALTDSVGSPVVTSNAASSGAALSEDSSGSMRLTSTASYVQYEDANILAQCSRKVYAGWLMTDDIQPPPKMIFSDGATTNVIHLVMVYGNNIMFEVASNGLYICQVYGPVLKPNRAYHICCIFEGSDFGNECSLYVDGVKMELSQDKNPNSQFVFGRGSNFRFGIPVSSNNIGSSVITTNCPVNMFCQHWAHWKDKEITAQQVKEILFEKGAIPEVTISSDTQENMQSSIDALSGTTRPDCPLCIRVEEVSGGGDLTLALNNIKFDPLSSIHVQYTGTGELTLLNQGGSDASKSSATNGGSVSIVESVNVSFIVSDITNGSRISQARVFIKAAAGGFLPEGQTIINGSTDANGELSFPFNFVSDQPIVGVVRKSEDPIFYSQSELSGTIKSAGLSQSVLLIPDS